MDVSLVYLGRNDKDKEMYKMCKAIAKKLNDCPHSGSGDQFRE
jgi:hypothetical protein